MKKWTVTVGRFQLDVVDSKGDMELVEICTQALEHLHENSIDYAVGATLKAECDGKIRYEKTDAVLANAGKYYEAAELQRQIKNADIAAKRSAKKKTKVKDEHPKP